MSLKNAYRPDIDGLRTIAVLLVILFHANVNFVQGGYIGVDVFFVISGFLITKSINKDILENKFSFKQFYLRRIRRIIPVLVFVTSIIAIPGYLFLLANHFENYARAALNTLLSTNNFYLWSNSADYFSESSEFQPLLHTWSLSVEEQFYILWPPILLFLHKKFDLKTRLTIVLVSIFCGLGLSIYLTKTDLNMAYFLLPARVFELLIGGGLALYWHKLPKLSKLQNNSLSIIAAFLIFIPAFLLDKNSFFPGYQALWPCLGAMLLIYTGKENTNALFNSVLKLKFMVFLGKLSYSMYLWHWPIFVFITYLGYELTGTLRVYAILLTIALSYTSWRFIEQPFRYRFKFNFKKTLAVVMLPSCVIIGVIYGVIDAKNGFPDRHPNLAEFDKNKNFPSKVRKACFNKRVVGNCEACYLGVKKDTLDGVLIGDSFANHTAAFLDVLAKDANLYIHDSAASGYPIMNDIDNDGHPVYPADYAIARMNYAKQFKTIYISANWYKFLDPTTKKYEAAIKDIEALIKLNKRVVLFDCLRETTNMNLHKQKLIKIGRKTSFNKNDLLIPKTKRPKHYLINVLKSMFPQIEIIDLNDAMCNDNTCKLEIENTIVYRNSDHLNTSGAKLMGKRYLQLKGNPLKNYN
ncbi:acyltransferase family protein [Postechiella marina]|uniref:Acyltransferase family protein n=1 Tax=Postechiella marina TaxID=943941 RepID=A0ABP8BZD9_9FLAO